MGGLRGAGDDAAQLREQGDEEEAGPPAGAEGAGQARRRQPDRERPGVDPGAAGMKQHERIAVASLVIPGTDTSEKHVVSHVSGCSNHPIGGSRDQTHGIGKTKRCGPRWALVGFHRCQGGHAAHTR